MVLSEPCSVIKLCPTGKRGDMAADSLQRALEGLVELALDPRHSFHTMAVEISEDSLKFAAENKQGEVVGCAVEKH